MAPVLPAVGLRDGELYKLGLTPAAAKASSSSNILLEEWA